MLYFNGIDGTNGAYLLEPRPDKEFEQILKCIGLRPPGIPKRLKFGVDPLDLGATGWGVVWPENPEPEICEALEDLLDHRRSQAGGRFRELTYLQDESPLDFLRRHGLGPDLVNPDKLPYYLLLAGSPDEIPFDFQFELGTQFAIGRICFDEAEDYAAYAQHLKDAEATALPEVPKITFFGVENPDDELSRWSVKKLTRPLAAAVASGQSDWRVETILSQEAAKARLVATLAEGPPSVLFTASHGLRFGPDNSRQNTYQGALLCADWPGPKVWKENGGGRIPDEHLFAAPDVNVGLDGLVAFHFACYSAGTPHLAPYAEENYRMAAKRPFVSSLPKRLLRQGALAVVGHVDIALEHSFLWHDNSQLETFDSTLQAIMAGHPVGHAMTQQFSDRLTQLSLHLLRTLSAGQNAKDPEAVLNRFSLWAAYHDARHYMTLGDPAARLNAGQ